MKFREKMKESITWRIETPANMETQPHTSSLPDKQDFQTGEVLICFSSSLWDTNLTGATQEFSAKI